MRATPVMRRGACARRAANRRPAVLLIDAGARPSCRLARALDAAGGDLSLARSAAGFLDEHPQRRFDLVLVDADPADPHLARDLLSLRAFFGEGPATRVVAIASLGARDLEVGLQQAGCDRVAAPPDLMRVARSEIAALRERLSPG